LAGAAGGAVELEGLLFVEAAGLPWEAPLPLGVLKYRIFKDT